MEKMDLNENDEKVNIETIFRSAMDMLSDDDKNAITTKVAAVKDALTKDDKDIINAAKEDLQKTLNDVATKLYQSAQAQGAPDMGGFNPDMGNAGPAAGNDGNVYDADFTDVN